MGDLGSVSGMGRSPEKERGIHSSKLCLENSMDCKSPGGCKELDTMIDQLTLLLVNYLQQVPHDCCPYFLTVIGPALLQVPNLKTQNAPEFCSLL